MLVYMMSVITIGGGVASMKHYNVRERLIDGTIKVIARDGLDKTTTKAITTETGLFETYIYQYFKNKDGLLVATFDQLDEELATNALTATRVFDDPSMDVAQQSIAYFTGVWNFMLQNKEKCVTYMRYYYSPYFSKYSAESHVARYAELTKKFSQNFRDEANTWMLLNHMLGTTMIFALRVINGELEDNEDTRVNVFNVINSAIVTYFK